MRIVFALVKRRKASHAAHAVSALACEAVHVRSQLFVRAFTAMKGIFDTSSNMDLFILRPRPYRTNSADIAIAVARASR